MLQPIPKAEKQLLFDEAQIQIREAQKMREAERMRTEEAYQQNRIVQEVVVSKRQQRKEIVQSIRVNKLA